MDDVRDRLFVLWRQVKECQVLLFSATVPSWVRNIANKYTANPLTVDAVGKHVSTHCVDDVGLFSPRTEGDSLDRCPRRA